MIEVKEEINVNHYDAAKALSEMVSQADFSKGKAGAIFRQLQKEKRIIVLKNNKPKAVILTFEEYKKLAENAENYRLLSLAVERVQSDNGHRTSQEDVMKEFGITKDDMESTPEVEIE